MFVFDLLNDCNRHLPCIWPRSEKYTKGILWSSGLHIFLIMSGRSDRFNNVTEKDLVKEEISMAWQHNQTKLRTPNHLTQRTSPITIKHFSLHTISALFVWQQPECVLMLRVYNIVSVSNLLKFTEPKSIYSLSCRSEVVCILDNRCWQTYSHNHACKVYILKKSRW